MDVFIGNFVGFLLILVFTHPSAAMSRREKQELKAKASEMFHHAYRSYMDHAYPADELMPLSCKGRYRGTHPSRGDIDDALGNFSLTLIDTLDTLVVLGEVDEFETAVRHVIADIGFDSDIVVSVFETNIRVVGGLLGGHLMADFLKQKKKRMTWYNDELLKMAQDLGDRLLPAFNTSTGMPYPRVNLRYGVKHENSRTGSEKDTCTACAGTMLLEFSALSRLTGNKIYENKAARAMDYLWESRHRTSDLVGTVINIHNGDWVRRESGIGAGIDSYYEYLLKGYIMLGKDTYLERFNKHYKAVMKYISNGPLMLDVHMHRPQMNSRNFMDALLAFWPGLQVLKGDLKSAIEIHEMLYQVTLRHNFLPEAFTSDFRVHWGQHPLRPEFLESTYFIYKATGDPYYLEVGKSVIENLNRHARVNCGFAALKDVTTGSHEDQMDSYVLAETFKYLYLLFSEKEDLILNVDDYVFTTEAHLLPLFLSSPNSAQNFTEDNDYASEDLRADGDEEEYDFRNTCPSTNHLFKGKIDFAHHLRSPLKNMVENLCPKPKSSESPRLKASEFIAGNKDQVALLNRMGIRIITMADGRVQLLHLANEAASPEDSSDGLLFMQEMVELSKAQASDASIEPRVVQLMSPPYFGSVVLKAGPAQFGVSLKNHPGIEGPLTVASPLRCCQALSNSGEVAGKFVMVERGDCMFVDKARHIQNAGALGAIIFDNNSQSSADSSQLFSMSGDGKADVIIPLVFLFRAEARAIQEALSDHPDLVIYVSERHKRPEDVLLQYLSYQSRSLAVESQRSRGSVDSSNSLSAESKSLSDSRVERAESDLESSIRGLIVLLLRRINLERLEPFIRRRSREKLDSRVGGSFPVRLIRMPDSADDDDDGVRVESRVGGDEETQHVVRIVFTEFLMLVLECTNLKQLSGLNQVVDALARLTESVFTGGRMGFGVHTETTIDEIRNRLVVKAPCSSPATTTRPAVPDAATERGEGAAVKSSSRNDGSRSVSRDDGDAMADFAGDDLDVEYERRKQLVRRFLEDQFGILPDGLTSASTQSQDLSHESPSHESSERSVFHDDPLLVGLPVDGPHLQEDDRLGEIRPRFNFASEEKSETVEKVSRDAVADVTICDPNIVVDDVGKVKISDVTGEPVWQDSRGVTWKHRDGCWRTERKSTSGKIENVALDEIGANEVVGARSGPPKRTSGDGVTDENTRVPWDSAEEGESYSISESDEEVIVEYNAQMSALEQRLRSSDDLDDKIGIDREPNHFADHVYDREAFETSRRRELQEEEEEEGEDFQFWEMGLGREERAEEDAERSFEDAQDHDALEIQVPNAVAGEESFVPKGDANSRESAPVPATHKHVRVPNSERFAPALLYGRARPKTDGAATDTSETDSEDAESPRTRN